MKKLLLHIGYPKTATTSLQEEVFVKLHQQKRINYLGRTTKSSHTRSGRSNFNGTDWVWHIRKHLILDQPLKYDNDVIKPGILNVISDEDLSFHDFFHFAQFRKAVNHNDFPKKLKKILGKDVEVSILLTLRNQTDLIFSSYLQKVRFIKPYIGNYSFSDFLKNTYNHNDRDQEAHLALYDFNALINLWNSEFAAQIDILLFEDFGKDQLTFFSELSKLLPASSEELQKFAGSKHYRKKDKSKDFFTTSYKSLSKFGRLVSYFILDKQFERFLERRYHMRFSLYLKYEQKLLLRHVKFKVPKPTDEERKFIKDYFHKSNLEFAKSYKLDFKKMSAYNYIK